MLWGYRTTSRTTIGETPFSLAFRAEAMLPVEIEIPSFRRANYDEGNNEIQMAAEVDLIDERRDQSRLRLAAYQQRTAKYYNSRVQQRRFQVNNLVLRRVFQNTKEWKAGNLGATWEGPYKIIEVMRPGTYKIASLGGRPERHPWNAEHLKIYYQ